MPPKVRLTILFEVALFVCILLILFVGCSKKTETTTATPAATTQPAAQPSEPAAPGYVAEVTDKSGSKMTVRAFSFGYTYGYTQAFCQFACGASAAAAMDFLPVNDSCGVTLVPLTEIKSVSSISRQSYDKPWAAAITYSDGRTAKVQFGLFGGEEVSRLDGQSALGKYSLQLDKVATIVFIHDQDVPPLAKAAEEVKEANESMNVVCKDGKSHALTRAALLEVGDSGRVYGATESLKVRAGDSEITMEWSRIKALTRKPEPNEDDKFSLTTTSGDRIDVALLGETRLGTPYVGGWLDGRFYYVKLADLKELTVTR